MYDCRWPASKSLKIGVESPNKIMVSIRNILTVWSNLREKWRILKLKTVNIHEFLTQINWHEMTMRQRCKNEARNAIKGLKKPFSNLSDSQFIEYDRLDPILSFSINWESDRLEKEWIRAQIHYNTNFGAKKRAKSRFWNLILEYIPCMNHTQNVFITWQKKHEFWRELLPKSRNSFNITDSKAILQRCENEEIGEVLARECGRNRTL